MLMVRNFGGYTIRFKRLLCGAVASLYILCGAFALCACTDDAAVYEAWGYVFGPLTCDLEFHGGKGKKAGNEIFEMMRAIDNAVSTSNAASAVYRFNNSTDKTPADLFEIDAMTYDMAVSCRALYQETGGLFDPAVYPLVEKWGVSSDYLYANHAEIGLSCPSDAEIEALLAYSKYDNLVCTQQGSGQSAKYYISVKSEAAKALKIDFGGYAKGYAADKAVGIAKKHGVIYGKVNISGNLYVFGKKADGNNWNINIGNPFGQTPFCTVSTEEISPVSSGVYERYFIIDSAGKWLGDKNVYPRFSGHGVYVAHIIDPGTGFPINLTREKDGEDEDGEDKFEYSNDPSGVVNATVLSSVSAEADVYAKHVSLLGLNKGIEFLEQKGLKGLIVTADKHYAAVGLTLSAQRHETFKEFTAVEGYEFMEK